VRHKVDSNPRSSDDATTAKDFYDMLKIFQDACTAREEQLEASNKLRPMARRVRIAILDTGITRAHKGIDAGFDTKRLAKERCYSWVGESTNVDDYDGHGTNVAALVLQIAPEADIYIAKVFSGAEVPIDETDNVAKVCN
jgi:hypothetical protein